MSIFSKKNAEIEKKRIEYELAEFGYSKFIIKESNITTIQIAKNIGTPYYHEKIQTVEKITPSIKSKLRTNTYSGNFGLDAFPFHTDLAHWQTPPHYVLLRCIQPAKDVKTLLIDFKELLSTEDESTLSRALFRPRKSINHQASLLRLSENRKIRWDSLFLQPVSTSGKDLSSRITEKINTSAKKEISLSSDKECLVIDNWRLAHGRTAIPKNCLNRKLERVYLSSVQGVHDV